MEELIRTLSDANTTAQNMRSLNEILTRILEIEQDTGTGEILSVKLGTGADRIECGGGNVAIADNCGRRVTLRELIFAVEYVEFLRSRGITIDNLPNTILGLTDQATARVQALTSLAGTNQILGTGYLGEYALLPQSSFAAAQTAANVVYRTDGSGATYGEARSAYQSSLTGVNQVYRTNSAGVTYGEARTAYQNQGANLDSIAALSLSANRYLGTDASGAIALLSQPSASMPARLVGEIQVVAFSVTGNPYTDDNGYLWYVADGTALSNANAKYQQLYTKLWPTTAYTVSGGRGASASADWSAGKSLQVPDMRGRAMAMTGQGSGLTSRTIASTWGAETAALAIANMPAHQHNVAVATIAVMTSNTGYGVITFGSGQGPAQSNVAGNQSAAGDGLGAIRSTGSGTAFSIVPPSIALTWLMWMNSQ